MIKAYKYRLSPTKSQAIFFEKSFGCVRFIYNWALNRRIEIYQTEGRTISAVDLMKELTPLKKIEDLAWLKEPTNECLQQSIRNLDTAYTKFFREKKGFPKYKSKHKSKNTCKFINNTSIDFDNKKIKIPKIGMVKFFCDREFEGLIKSITISKSTTGKYYASVLVDNGVELPKKSLIKENTTVGIDVGLKTFAVLSNGVEIQNPKFYQKEEKRLKILQKRASKKIKGSNRRKKANKRVAKLHEKIKNKRSDFIHHSVNQILSENQTVVIEDLNVDGMLKNHCLAKSIQSASWSEFFRVLKYKCDWQGKNLIRIGRFEPSSRLCTCGVVNKELTLKDRVWTCKSCNTIHDRDVLAANNIKKFGLLKANLIHTPVVGGEADVELPTIVGTMKR